ncbi:MAG TPA: betaine/proline/choline family ABC transporter ATP-binding protein [Egibacteraceae bacterium]
MTTTRDSEAMIRLEDLTKVFPGQKQPAVDHLTMEIPEGEIVVLVGPSGCGKTTTMKLINRIIEPTSGRIFIAGEDVTKKNPDQLRRGIGYVIQQIGLFPHMTIRENIATVPKMLKWPRERIDARVDELLETVGLDPARYRDRYPKELSGGQRQRVGVARALSADPPVMLMDEPFGAIDPITRERLQNEFLRVQEEIRKTIVFVTHDIDEAIKMGDRIAIMRSNSHIAQYDTPEAILSSPADDFVSDFIGSGASLKRLGLATVRDYELSDWPIARVGEDLAVLRQRLRESDERTLLLLDDENRPLRWLTAKELERDDVELGSAGLEVRARVEPTASLADALNEIVASRVGCAVVVDKRGAYLGIVDMTLIMTAAEEMRRVARERLRELAERGEVEPEEVSTP